jgi:hypothetical protein
MTGWRDPLLRAWLALLVLSTAGTGVAVRQSATSSLAPWLGALVLLFAGIKARLILVRYLGLAKSPSWRKGFTVLLVLLLGLLLGLFLAG